MKFIQIKNRTGIRRVPIYLTRIRIRHREITIAVGSTQKLWIDNFYLRLHLHRLLAFPDESYL